jgi:DNA-binding transcriptional LysR family regulator
MQFGDHHIGRQIKLQDLRIFMAVVHAGSMGKAARQLSIGQPNISASIANMERALGVSLLDRRPQGVEPTAYGRALLDCGTAMFDDLRQGLSRIRSLADPTAGEVRIGTTAVLGASFVPAIIDRLSKRYPRVVFHIVARPEILLRELSERKLDLLITWRLAPIADKRLHFEHLFDDRLVVVAGAQNRWVRRRALGLADLVNEPWVLPPAESWLGSGAMESFRLSGLDFPGATVVAGLPHTRISLVATGRFLTIVPASVLRFPTRRQGIKVLPVELPVSSSPVGIATLKNRTLSPVVQLFSDYAREMAKPLARHRG